MKKIKEFIITAVMPQCMELTAKLREPVKKPAEDIQRMAGLIKDMTAGLGDGPAQAWATLAALASGNNDLIEAAEFAKSRTQHQAGQLVVIESDTMGHGWKIGSVLLVSCVGNGVTTAIRAKDGYAANVARSGPNTTSQCDVRPATDEEIKEFFEKLGINEARTLLNCALVANSQLSSILN